MTHSPLGPPPLRLGMIGTGRFATQMAPRIAASPDVALAGVLSRDGGRAEALAAGHGARGYTDLAAMADHVDAIYVCGATGRHVPDSLAAMAAGLPVLCEKPMGTDAEGTGRVLDAAQAAGVLFAEAFWTGHLPAWQGAKALLADGALGRPMHLNADLSRDMPRAEYPRVWSPDDGAMRDLGVYPISLAVWLLGPGALTEADVTWVGGVDAKARLRLDHEDGAQSLLSLSFLGAGPCEAVLTGEAAALTIETPLLGAQAVSLGDERRAYPIPAGRYDPQFAHFAGLVREGATESPVVPHALSRNVAEIVAAARAA